MSALLRSDPATLEVQALTVRFGGVVAVDGVSLRAPAGTVTGLIGPNGAGKTTTFNACSGLVRTAAGEVLLGGKRLGRASPAARAQLGLGRTFQRVALFDTMSVGENVALGHESRLAGRRWWNQLGARRSERSQSAAAARDAMTRCGIESLADAMAGELSTGQQRLVELARALAGRFRFLLLDEPSSGLDGVETGRIGDVIKAVAAQGMGVLLVEHDLDLVRDVCESVFVLDFGRLVLGGPTDEVLASELVHTAYLGAGR